MNARRIVISGLGVVSPVGIGWNDFAESIAEGRSGIGVLPDFENEGDLQSGGSSASDFAPGYRRGGYIHGFEPKKYVRPRKALKVMCREIQTAFAASMLALEDGGLSFDSDELGVAKDRIATVFGSEMLYDPIELVDAAIASASSGASDVVSFGDAAMKKVSPLWLLKYLPNMAACHVGIALGALGPNNTITMGDTSGPSALAEAVSYMNRGIADIALVGCSGTSISETRIVYRGDAPMPMQNGDGQTHGVFGGEAGIAMTLETDDAARQRGHTPDVELLSVARRFVASSSIMAPSNGHAEDRSRGSESAIAKAIEAAMVQAEISPDQVAGVVSHAIGDPDRDDAESQAIEATLPSGIPVALPSLLTGHAGAASGAVGLATAVGMIRRRTWVDAEKPCLIALAHTSQGAATATVLGRYAG